MKKEQVFQKTGVLKRLLSCLGALVALVAAQRWPSRLAQMIGVPVEDGRRRILNPSEEKLWNGRFDVFATDVLAWTRNIKEPKQNNKKKHDLTTNYHMKQNHKILKPSTQRIFHHHTNHRLRALWLSIPYHSMRSPRIPCFPLFPFPCYILHLFHFYCHCKSLERFCFVRVLVCLIWPGKLLWSRILRLE